MVTPAVVTAVQEDHLRADVKLLGNGAEIKGMLNKSPGKLTVGQTVTVAYSTLPSSGVILIANGETDPLSEGGGWEVENAVLYDAANLHEYTADTTLMADISPNTKLYYGANNNRMIVVQGMLCYYGSEPTSSTWTAKMDAFLTANAQYIMPEYNGIISYYYSGSTVYRFETDIKVFPLQITIGTNDRAGYNFRIMSTVKSTNLSTSEVTVRTYTSDGGPFTVDNIEDITDYGMLLITSRFGAASPNQVLDAYVPYGYVGSNVNLGGSVSGYNHLYVGLAFKNSNPSVNKWNVGYSGSVGTLWGNRGGAITPLTNAETTLALGATQRTEPSGGGD